MAMTFLKKNFMWGKKNTGVLYYCFVPETVDVLSSLSYKAFLKSLFSH